MSVWRCAGSGGRWPHSGPGERDTMSHYQRILAAEAKYPNNLPNHPLSLSHRKSRLQPSAHLTKYPGSCSQSAVRACRGNLSIFRVQLWALRRWRSLQQPRDSHLVTFHDSSEPVRIDVEDGTWHSAVWCRGWKQMTDLLGLADLGSDFLHLCIAAAQSLRLKLPVLCYLTSPQLGPAQTPGGCWFSLISAPWHCVMIAWREKWILMFVWEVNIAV